MKNQNPTMIEEALQQLIHAHFYSKNDQDGAILILKSLDSLLDFHGHSPKEMTLQNSDQLVDQTTSHQTKLGS